MNPIEKAIRSALEKGDAGDRAYREKVYRSVHAALEKALESNPDASADAVRQRREMLKSSISTIEAEFIPAVAPVDNSAAIPPSDDLDALSLDVSGANSTSDAPPVAIPAVAARPVAAPPVVVPPAPVSGSGDGVPEVRPSEPRGRPAPSVAAVAAPRPEPRVDPRAGEPAVEPRDPRQGAPALQGERREPRRRGRGRFYAATFLAVTFITAIVIGVWWASENGFFLSAEERDTSVRNPPTQLESEEFDPNGNPPPLGAAGGGSENWITVFSPDDPTAVTTPAGAEAEVVDTDAGPALRIRSAAADAPVMFDVGQGVLEQVAGKRALFDIVALAEDGKPTQISVTCNFGELGDCGRNRYDISGERADYLLDVDLPDANPGSAGTIAIASDVDNQGKAVLILEIRVSVAR